MHIFRRRLWRLSGAGRGKRVLKVENKSKEKIAEFGRKIGEAFSAEKAGIVTLVTEEQPVRVFEIMIDYFYAGRARVYAQN